MIENILSVSDGISKLKQESNSKNVFFVGAGISVPSNIPSGIKVIDILKDKFPNKLDKTKYYEYSEAFNLVFPGDDFKAERRSFFENICIGKSTNIVHHYLVKCLSNGFADGIITTNFDHLLEQSLFLEHNNRCSIYLYDDLITRSELKKSVPKLLKIHGDFLFDDLANLKSELVEKLKLSMRKKITEYCDGKNLIVLGYGGGDETVMQLFNELIKNDNTNIYWSLYNEDALTPALIELYSTNQEKVNFIGFNDGEGFLKNLFDDYNLEIPKKSKFGISESISSASFYMPRFSLPQQEIPSPKEGYVQNRDQLISETKDLISLNQNVFINRVDHNASDLLIQQISKWYGGDKVFYFNPNLSFKPKFSSLKYLFEKHAYDSGINLVGSTDFIETVFNKNHLVIIDDYISVDQGINKQLVNVINRIVEAQSYTKKGAILITGLITDKTLIDSEFGLKFFHHLKDKSLTSENSLEKTNNYLNKIKSYIAEIYESQDDRFLVLKILIQIKISVNSEEIQYLTKIDNVSKILNKLSQNGIIQKSDVNYYISGVYRQVIMTIINPFKNEIIDLADKLMELANQSNFLKSKSYVFEAERLYYSVGEKANGLRSLISIINNSSQIEDSEYEYFISDIGDYVKSILEGQYHILDSLSENELIEFNVLYLSYVKGNLKLQSSATSNNQFELSFIRHLIQSRLSKEAKLRLKAKLYQADEQYDKYLETLDDWKSEFKNNKEIEAEVNFLMSGATYYQQFTDPEEYLSKILVNAEKAVSHYQDAKGITDPNYIMAVNNNVAALLNLERYDDADKLNKKILSESSKYASFSEIKSVTYGNQFLIELKKREYDRAESFLFESILNNIYLGRWKGIFLNLSYLLEYAINEEDLNPNDVFKVILNLLMNNRGTNEQEIVYRIIDITLMWHSRASSERDYDTVTEILQFQLSLWAQFPEYFSLFKFIADLKSLFEELDYYKCEDVAKKLAQNNPEFTREIYFALKIENEKGW